MDLVTDEDESDEESEEDFELSEKEQRFLFFFLQCRIAQDSCGHVPAKTESKKKPTTTPLRNKTKTKQLQPTQHTQHTKQGSGCGKRDVKYDVRHDVKQPADPLL